MNSGVKTLLQSAQNSFFGFVKKLAYNFATLNVKTHYGVSVMGIVVFFVIVAQIVSGIALALSLTPEPMLIPSVRDEEDADAIFTDDFFWLHERGVDAIFVFSYIHLGRKLYLMKGYLMQEFAWKSGVFLLILIQVVTFLGLVLCSTHLSDITLKIASNTMHQIFQLKTKVFWWLFTDKNLNGDTIIRMAYLHYISAFALTALALMHSIDMHYDWTADYNADALRAEMQWWNEVFLNEFMTLINALFLIFLAGFLMYTEPEAVHYEQFMWGDIGFITDPNFNQVAPHWYFRPLMAFLLVVPHALVGVGGLGAFFVLLYYQVNLQSRDESVNHVRQFKGLANSRYIKNYSVHNGHVDFSFWYQARFYTVILAVLYTSTFLPNGKYYLALGGNDSLLTAYAVILLHLAFPPHFSITAKKANVN